MEIFTRQKLSGPATPGKGLRRKNPHTLCQAPPHSPGFAFDHAAAFQAAGLGLRNLRFSFFIAVVSSMDRARPQPGARRQVSSRARGGRPHARQRRQRDRARDAGASRGPRGADGWGRPVQRAVQLSGGGDGRQLEVRAFEREREDNDVRCPRVSYRQISVCDTR